MATLAAVETKPFVFDYPKWNSSIRKLSSQYSSNRPGPHIYLEQLIDWRTSKIAAAEFPAPTSQEWIHYKHQNENKLGLTKLDLFPAALREITEALNAPEFLQWLSALTGIPDLMADPLLEGGGLHQSVNGGFLNVHTDFSMHHYHKNWRRRVNLILYLNPMWQEEWGGDIELWDAGMKRCEAKYPPFLNNALIFNTTDISYHGFPDPIRCPQDQSRKSLALYYYTAEDGGTGHARSTNYRARPSDSLIKSALIWLDKMAVDVYSRAKARFGFSDDFASKILGIFSKK